MAFTEEQLEKQREQFEVIKEEFARLNSRFDATLKAAGLTEADLKNVDTSAFPPEVLAAAEKSKEEAKRAGEARAAQNRPENKSGGCKTPGARRKGVVRL